MNTWNTCTFMQLSNKPNMWQQCNAKKSSRCRSIASVNFQIRIKKSVDGLQQQKAAFGSIAVSQDQESEVYLY